MATAVAEGLANAGATAQKAVDGGKALVGAAQSAYHFVMPAAPSANDARQANKRARAGNVKFGGKTQATMRIPNLRGIQMNPVRNVSFHPMCPFPPIMTTTLQQTHQLHMNNGYSVAAGSHNLPTPGAGATGIVTFSPRANAPVGPFGYHVASLGHGKSIPYHNWLMANLYNNYIVYGAKIHFSIIEDQNELANRIQYDHTSHPSDSAFNSLKWYLKLHSGVETGGLTWGDTHGGPKTFDGTSWINMGMASTNGTTNGPGWIASFDNWEEWEEPGSTTVRRGSFPERAKYFVDNLISCEVPAGLGKKSALLSGHWDLKQHEGVDWDRLIQDDDYAAQDSRNGDYKLFETWAAGGAHAGMTPHSLEPNGHPRWYLWCASDDSNFKPTIDWQIRCTIEYQIAYFNLKNPQSETIRDEIQNV